MSPFTKPFRASILARARFIEDLVTAQAALGVGVVEVQFRRSGCALTVRRLALFAFQQSRNHRPAWLA
jgi:hypothetical protein